MNTKIIDSISDQIAAARKSVSERPDWMKSVAHFSEPRLESNVSTKSQVPAIRVNQKA
jgi:hypothetical protein